MSTKFSSGKRYSYKGLTEEEKKKKRIQINTEEYEGYENAGAWLEENSEYARFAVNKLLDYYKYSRLKSFRLDIHQEAFLVVLDRFPKYKPGLRGVNSWLYQQIHWYIGKLLRRKYLRHYSRTVGFPNMAETAGDYFKSPEIILIEREEAQEVSKLKTNLTEDV